ncbi:MAG: hypothetical protein OHK0057_29070 [Thermoflexibacter sp.]
MKSLVKKIIVFLGLFMLGFFIGQHIAKAQNASPSLLWEISGKDLKQPSYLFGTFHVLCPQDLMLTEAIKSKVKASQQLVLELDMDDPNLMTEMQKSMVMSNGKTLKEYLNEKDYAVIEQFFKDSLGLPLDQLATFKPFMLSSMLYTKYLGCQTASWEMTFVQLAKAQNAEVLGLETIADQMKAIDFLPYPMQAKSLLESITEYEKYRKELREMLYFYKNQDVEKMYAVSIDYFSKEMQGMEKVMLEDRNRNWIPKIEKMCKEKPTFFAVGAGHLGGETGIISLLRKQGYTVKPIENKQEIKSNITVSESNANQHNEITKLLIRKWKPDESVIPQMVEDVIEGVRKRDAKQAKQLEGQKMLLAQMLSNVTTEYKTDNTFFVDIPNSPQSGTWKLSEDSKRIIRKDTNGKESVNEILEITDKKLVVLNSDKKKIIFIAL